MSFTAESLRNNLTRIAKTDVTKDVAVPYDTLGKEIVDKIALSNITKNILVLSDVGLLTALISHFRKNHLRSDNVKFIAHTQEIHDFALSVRVASILVPYDNLDLYFSGSVAYNHIASNGDIMKFDVVIGNPPYNPPDSSANGESIWDKFVLVGWDRLNDGGYLYFVTPSGWRHKVKKKLRDSGIYEIVTRHVTEWSGCKNYFGNAVGNSIDIDWWIAQKGPPLRDIQFLPRDSSDVHAVSIFNKLHSYNSNCLKMLENGFDRNEKRRGTFKHAQTSKHWLKGSWQTCSKPSRTHFQRKVIISSSGDLGAIYDDGDCSTSNHSHGIAARDEAHGNQIIATLKSKTVKFIAQQLVPAGSLENPVVWFIPCLPDSSDINKALSLTPAEIAYIETLVK